MVEGPTSIGSSYNSAAAGATVAKNDVACAAGIPVVLGRLVHNRGTGRETYGIVTCSMAAGRSDGDTRGEAIRELAEVLGDVKSEMTRVESSVEANNEIVNRSI